MSVFTLAVGIGVATLVFSIVDHLMYRPVAGVTAQHELAVVRIGAEDDWNSALISKPDFEDMAAGTPALSGMAAYQHANLQAALGPEGAEPLYGHAVIGDYFGTLGTTPQRGRLFAPQELEGSADPRVAVISDALWREQFGARPVLGATIRMNAHPFTIIGVAPRGFGGPYRARPAQVWVPGVTYGMLRHMSAERVSASRRDAGWYGETIGRLAKGATIEQARQQLQAVVDRLVEEYPESADQYAVGPVDVQPGIGLETGQREIMARIVRLLLVIGAFVLIVACANVANLLLFRAVNTRGEGAIRRALGATDARVLQHHAAQGFVIAALAALLGIVFAAGMRLVLRDTGLPRIGKLEAMSIDGRVMLFAVALAAVTSILFAVIPTLLARRVRLLDLYGGGRTETGRVVWVRRVLVVTQMALASALVIPGILMAGTVRNLSNVDLGFDTRGLTMFGISTEEQGYDEKAVIGLREQLLAEIARQPGITAVSLTSAQLLAGGGFFDRYRGPVQGEGAPAYMNTVGVSRGYFETVGIDIIQGRSFRSGEDNLPEVPGGGVVLNRTAAIALFGADNAVGRTIRASREEELTVIGVVEDSRSFGLRADPRPAAYRPISQNWWLPMYVLVRSNVDNERTERLAGDAVAAINPNIPFFRTLTLQDAVDDAMSQERLFARLATTLAALASVLSGIGLYGLMAYAVARRGREIGIRMALGARRSHIVTGVTSESLIFALLGSIIGWIGGVMLVKFVRSMLFGVTALDSRIYLATALLFTVIAIVSCTDAGTGGRIGSPVVSAALGMRSLRRAPRPGAPHAQW